MKQMIFKYMLRGVVGSLMAVCTLNASELTQKERENAILEKAGSLSLCILWGGGLPDALDTEENKKILEESCHIRAEREKGEGTLVDEKSCDENYFSTDLASKKK